MGHELDKHGASEHFKMEAGAFDALPERIGRLEARLGEINAKLDLLVEQRTLKDWYSTEEVAKIVNKAEYTVREWCRQGRITAKKKICGRGKGGEWLISHEELARFKNEGLRPLMLAEAREGAS